MIHTQEDEDARLRVVNRWGTADEEALLREPAFSLFVAMRLQPTQDIVSHQEEPLAPFLRQATGIDAAAFQSLSKVEPLSAAWLAPADRVRPSPPLRARPLTHRSPRRARSWRVLRGGRRSMWTLRLV